VALPLFNCARDSKASKRFVRVAVEEYGRLFVVADCESAGGEERRERGVIAEFEMVVDERERERERERETDEAATKTMFHHRPQQPFERLRVYMVKLPSLFVFVHLCTSPTPTFEYHGRYSSFVSSFFKKICLLFFFFFSSSWGRGVIYIYIYIILFLFLFLFFPIFKNFKNARIFKKNVE
jgi:hypothetical protein